ncbi:unnamed protein product [Mytilus coruscus]|uniref:Reverse transcriptase RNase H-like domain-containing protein n=1 Tax=Mytilus coruscus TaxID=42192 RepID=A0A6J8C695_MYTCO|nr:unnamed protein product [Mytilus coruscus]
MNLDNTRPDVSDKHGTFDNNYVLMCQSSLLNNFINVNMDSLSMHAMIDTGADISVANPSILSKLDSVGINVVVMPSDKKVIINANDEHVEIVGTINIDLTVDDESSDVRFYLVPCLTPQLSRDLKVEERSQLNDLLRKYSNVFVNKEGKLGQCEVIEHEMHIPDTCKPIRQRPYKLGVKQKEVLENVVSDMLKDGIIEPSTSPWAASCLLVAKKSSNTTNTDYRFVVDFRRVNECIELNSHPLLTTEHALEASALSNQRQSLSKQEQQYGITGKECLALVYAVKKFDCYLRFIKFTAYVDHSTLKWLLTLKEPTGKFVDG